MYEEEHDVIRRVQQGNINDFKVLVLKYQSAVFNLLYNMLRQHAYAEELTQDVFVKAYENLHTFNFSSRFFSWIYRIAVNTAISQRKLQQRHFNMEPIPHSPVISAEENFIVKERDLILQNAISQLNEKHKAVIVLKYFEQFSYSEIAEIMRINEKKVKSRLFEAHKILKGILERSDYFRNKPL
ncbi:MAG: RNA polymerase sigma factor [Bacteroidales bacterium]|nr:RNA polymerase sigma factor [Bacteroidales bacterium]